MDNRRPLAVTPYSLIFIVIFLLTGCSKQNEAVFKDPSGGIYRLSIDPTVNKALKLSNYFDKVSYVPLQSDSNSIFAEISSLKCKGNRIYILDTHNTASLFVFRNDGKFLFKIGAAGKGPGEFATLHDFAIDPANGNIAMLDLTTNKTKMFDSTGVFLSERSTPTSGMHFEYIAEGQYAMFNFFTEKRDEYNLVVVNERDEVIRKYFKNELPGRTEALPYPRTTFYESNGNTYFIHPYVNTVYRFDKGQLVKDYDIRFPGHDLPSDILSDKRVLNFENFLKNGSYVTGLNSFYQVDSTLFFSYFFREFVHFCAVDLKKGTAASSMTVQNDIVENLPFNMLIGATDKEVISYLDLETILSLKDFLRKNPNIKISDQLKELVDRVDENSNPVLVFYTLKS